MMYIGKDLELNFAGPVSKKKKKKKPNYFIVKPCDYYNPSPPINPKDEEEHGVWTTRYTSDFPYVSGQKVMPDIPRFSNIPLSDPNRPGEFSYPQMVKKAKNTELNLETTSHSHFREPLILQALQEEGAAKLQEYEERRAQENSTIKYVAVKEE